jgi:argininosuccinate lyase
MIKHDVYGSIAQAAMLKKIGVITTKEFKTLQTALKKIIILWEDGKFIVKPADEDGHTAIENYLVKQLGDLGKKIHTARSRNDQVVTMTRLYTKERILDLYNLTINLADNFLTLAKDNEFVPMPGYTHMQRAMPTSGGVWFDQFAEALLDDLQLLKTAYHYNDMSPLGSAAGFGVNMKIDRAYTAKLLGFSKVQNNTLYVSYTRGKIEAVILFAVNQLMQTLAKFSNDVLIFSMSETGFVELPQEFCTGSSLMPQKKNGDVFELTRGKANVSLGYLISTIEMQNVLLSGYNRDSQLTKDLLCKGLDLYENTVKVMLALTKGITLNKTKCLAACTPEIFATDYALDLVKHGMPFRDAYRHVSNSLDELEQIDPVNNIRQKTHLGASGNLQLNQIKQAAQLEKTWVKSETNKWVKTINTLLK